MYGWVSVLDMYQNFPINQALDIWVSVSAGHVWDHFHRDRPSARCMGECQCWTCMRPFPSRSTKRSMYGWVSVLDMYETISIEIDQALDVWVSVSAGHVWDHFHRDRPSARCMGECQCWTCMRPFPSRSTKRSMYGWVSVLDMYETISIEIDQALDVWVSVSAGHVWDHFHRDRPSARCMGECQCWTCMRPFPSRSTKRSMYGWVSVLDMYETISIEIDQALDVWVSVSAGHVWDHFHRDRPSARCMGECQCWTCMRPFPSRSTKRSMYGWVSVLNMYHQNIRINEAVDIGVNFSSKPTISYIFLLLCVAFPLFIFSCHLNIWSEFSVKKEKKARIIKMMEPIHKKNIIFLVCVCCCCMLACKIRFLEADIWVVVSRCPFIEFEPIVGQIFYFCAKCIVCGFCLLLF